MESTDFDIISSAIRSCYKKNLISCAIFGSFSRKAETPGSDLDILIIANNLPRGRMARSSQFAEIEKTIESSGRWKGVCISPVFKTPDEAQRGSPLFWDMTDSVIILHDTDGYLEKILSQTRRSLQKNGAYRVIRGNAWYWVLKRDFSPGEVFTL